MSVPDPHTPVRYDHRYLHRILSITFKGKVLMLPSELSRLSRVFVKAGGSWERIHKGSSDDISLLKKVVNVAYRKGFLTKTEKWV